MEHSVDTKSNAIRSNGQQLGRKRLTAHRSRVSRMKTPIKRSTLLKLQRAESIDSAFIGCQKQTNVLRQRPNAPSLDNIERNRVLPDPPPFRMNSSKHRFLQLREKKAQLEKRQLCHRKTNDKEEDCPNEKAGTVPTENANDGFATMHVPNALEQVLPNKVQGIGDHREGLSMPPPNQEMTDRILRQRNQSHCPRDSGTHAFPPEDGSRSALSSLPFSPIASTQNDSEESEQHHSRSGLSQLYEMETDKPSSTETSPPFLFPSSPSKDDSTPHQDHGIRSPRASSLLENSHVEEVTAGEDPHREEVAIDEDCEENNDDAGIVGQGAYSYPCIGDNEDHPCDSHSPGILFVDSSSTNPLVRASSLLLETSTTEDIAITHDCEQDCGHFDSTNNSPCDGDSTKETVTACKSPYAYFDYINETDSSLLINEPMVSQDEDQSTKENEGTILVNHKYLGEACEGDNADSSLSGETHESSTVIATDNDENDNTVRFHDIIGHQSVKLRLEEVLLPLAFPPNLSKELLKGIRSLPASILLYGPPGCGKTQLAKALAGEAHAAFLSIGPSDILSKYVGESEAAIRSVFDEAIRLAQASATGNKCTVLFFDEIDAMGQSRGFSDSGTVGASSSDNSSRRLLAELLIQLTKVNSSHGTFDSQSIVESDDRNCEAEPDLSEEANHDDGVCLQKEGDGKEHPELVRVIVVAATNRPADCDPALLRRFAVQVPVGMPTKRDRRKILKRNMKDIEHTITKQQFLDLASATNGFSGSDLQSFSREAAMAPVRECIRRGAMWKRRKLHCRSSSVPTQGSNKVESVDNDIQEHVGNTIDRCGGDHITSARKRLLEDFRNLRPVNFRDFTRALTFWFGRMYSNLYDSPLAAFGWIEANTEADKSGCKVLNEHYDSSSEEENDDDDDDDDDSNSTLVF